MTTLKFGLTALLAASLLWTCRGPYKAPATVSGSVEPALVTERFISRPKRRENVDSIAFYGAKQWAVVTAKSTDTLVVFDANNGERLRVVGGTGSAPGRLKRPNGIAIIDDLLLVVERDNARVQLMRLPDFNHLGFIGGNHLIKPYGLTVFAKDGAYELYVTDDYDRPEDSAATLPEDFYTRRVKHFRFRLTGDTLTADKVRHFGDASGRGRLFKVESILADPQLNRLYIADEQGEHKGVKIYDLAGTFTGKSLPTVNFAGEPEGLALYLGEKQQYLVTTDQRPRVTVFHLFERESLKHVAAFRGERTNNTDGICVTAQGLPQMPQGALWAIDDDRALSGFDWQHIQHSSP